MRVVASAMGALRGPRRRALHARAHLVLLDEPLVRALHAHSQVEHKGEDGRVLQRQVLIPRVRTRRPTHELGDLHAGDLGRLRRAGGREAACQQASGQAGRPAGASGSAGCPMARRRARAREAHRTQRPQILHPVGREPTAREP